MIKSYKEKANKECEELESECIKLTLKKESIIKEETLKGDCVKTRSFSTFNINVCTYSCENANECEVKKKVMEIENEISEKRKVIANNKKLVNDLNWD